MKPLIEFARKGGEGKVEFVACGKCGYVYPLSNKDLAEGCCACTDCGAKLSGTGRVASRCRSCRSKHYDRMDEQRREKAQKIPEAEYDGPLWLFDGRYYESVGELYDDCWSREEEIPAEAWACDVSGLKVDGLRIVEGLLEDHHEDAIDRVVDLDDFVKFCREWSDKQTLKGWFGDYKRLVVFDPKGREEFLKDYPEDEE